jgi:hypothetical protein
MRACIEHRQESGETSHNSERRIDSLPFWGATLCNRDRPLVDSSDCYCIASYSFRTCGAVINTSQARWINFFGSITSRKPIPINQQPRMIGK